MIFRSKLAQDYNVVDQDLPNSFQRKLTPLEAHPLKLTPQSLDQRTQVLVWN